MCFNNEDLHFTLPLCRHGFGHFVSLTMVGFAYLFVVSMMVLISPSKKVCLVSECAALKHVSFKWLVEYIRLTLVVQWGEQLLASLQIC